MLIDTSLRDTGIRRALDMPDPPIQPFDHPAAWKTTDFASKDDLAVDLEHRHRDALEKALEHVKATTPEHGEIAPAALLHKGMGGIEKQEGRGEPTTPRPKAPRRRPPRPADWLL